MCISNKDGDCRPQTPPIAPPVKEEGCSANVCFLLDGSKSLINVVSARVWSSVVWQSTHNPVAAPSCFAHPAHLVCTHPISPHPTPPCPPSPQDAWNDVVASARSIMYSIADPAAVFDVFWFSNDVERIGEQVRCWWCGVGQIRDCTLDPRRAASQTSPTCMSWRTCKSVHWSAPC